MAVPPRDRPDQWAKWAIGIVAAIGVIVVLAAGIAALSGNDDDADEAAVDATTTTVGGELATTTSETPGTTAPATSDATSAPPPPAHACTGDYELDDRGAEQFLAEFMRVRVAGTGAERCATEEALEIYDREASGDFDADDDETLCLYECGDADVVGFAIGEILFSGDQFEAAITVVLQDSEGTRYEYTEFVEAGPGTAATGDDSDLIIRSAGRDL